MTAEPNRIQLYDATLRDGMGGGGMSLSAEEKLRVVHALDELGVHLIEAGFPASNPKERELFELLARERLRERRDRRLRHDPPARHRRRRATRACAVLAESFAPVCTLVGKASVLHVEKVVRVSREENLRDDRRLGRVPARGRASACCSTPSTSSTASRSTPATRCDCLRAAAEAGAERLVLCDTNGGSLPPQIRTALAVVARSAAAASRWASTATTTPAARSRTR